MNNDEITEVFDTYKRKTKLYYILQIISLLTIGGLVLGKIEDIQIPHAYYTLFIALLAFGLLTTFVNLILTGTNLVKMYRKDGEISISTNAIGIDSLDIPLSDIKEIEISANDYRGARTSDGSGNHIEIVDNSNKRYLFRFVIESKDQRNKLNEILDHLKSKGIRIR
ncbi:MAG TPA: hypothetical protein VHB54_07640 [Mucilaginibacter sp.]|nr:hypothetical protein [Mucilaginibacter sp.]